MTILDRAWCGFGFAMVTLLFATERGWVATVAALLAVSAFLVVDDRAATRLGHERLRIGADTLLDPDLSGTFSMVTPDRSVSRLRFAALLAMIVAGLRCTFTVPTPGSILLLFFVGECAMLLQSAWSQSRADAVEADPIAPPPTPLPRLGYSLIIAVVGVVVIAHVCLRLLVSVKRITTSGEVEAWTLPSAVGADPVPLLIAACSFFVLAIGHRFRNWGSTTSDRLPTRWDRLALGALGVAALGAEVLTGPNGLAELLCLGVGMAVTWTAVSTRRFLHVADLCALALVVTQLLSFCAGDAATITGPTLAPRAVRQSVFEPLARMGPTSTADEQENSPPSVGCIEDTGHLGPATAVWSAERCPAGVDGLITVAHVTRFTSGDVPLLGPECTADAAARGWRGPVGGQMVRAGPLEVRLACYVLEGKGSDLLTRGDCAWFDQAGRVAFLAECNSVKLVPSGGWTTRIAPTSEGVSGSLCIGASPGRWGASCANSQGVFTLAVKSADVDGADGLITELTEVCRTAAGRATHLAVVPPEAGRDGGATTGPQVMSFACQRQVAANSTGDEPAGN